MALSRRDLFPLLMSGLFTARAEPLRGTALLVSVAERKVMAARGADRAGKLLVAPGSTLKPFTLWALLESGKLSATDEYLCPGSLSLAGHSLNCSHSMTAVPMNVPRAIAYSCNCAVAHFAERLAPGELPNFLQRVSLFSSSDLLAGPEATGSVRRDLSGAELQVQALGEDGLRVTPLELLMAYRMLARRSQETAMAPILEGLEGAVEYGTGQRAKLKNVRVAGKTGSIRDAAGARAAWFAGFAPSRTPEVAVTVLVEGASGGADAAPIAGQMLEAYFAGRG